MTYCDFDTTMPNAFSYAMTQRLLRGLDPLENGDEVLKIFLDSSDLMRCIFDRLPEHVELDTSLTQLKSDGHHG